MSQKSNPRQLVLRRDTATGLTHVGWETDLPLVRFEHLALIGELADNVLPDRRSQHHAAYQTALRQARCANRIMLERQTRANQSRGWYHIPFELACDPNAMQADSVGNYASAAMQLQYQLTHNCKHAWVVHADGVITHVQSRYPKTALDELTYQVWYHKQLHDLKCLGGTLMEGTLRVCESGLWFESF